MSRTSSFKRSWTIFEPKGASRMSDTHHRRHLSKGERARRGGKLRDDYRDRPLKTKKQQRVNEKARLRKEHT
jgi:hypothetical protein